MTDVPDSVADCDAYVAEARQAELNAGLADHSGQAAKYVALYDAVLEMRPMVAMRERIDHGAAPSLG
ncbi:MAG: hypothetical protein JWO69_2013 [Thermoleophilia bacterium]|nr:hypothetical protein [Thermoleophilia bacterium]